MTRLKIPAIRSSTAKTRYCRRAECSCDNAKRMPRMASMNLRRAGGMALEMVDTGSVESLRKYEFRDSSTGGPSCVCVSRRSPSSSPAPNLVRRIVRPASSSAPIPAPAPADNGDLARTLSPHPGLSGTRLEIGELMPIPRCLVSSTGPPLSLRSAMIFAWLCLKSGSDFLAVRLALRR
jgi:hypothetical protein